MTVHYEWCIGITDPETGDMSVSHCDDAAFAMASYRYAAERSELVTLELTRDQGNLVEGLTNRSWALFDPDTGTLPEFTSYGDGEEAHKVPRRFHDQIAKLI